MEVEDSTAGEVLPVVLPVVAAANRCCRFSKNIRNGTAIGNNATDKIAFAALGTCRLA